MEIFGSELLRSVPSGHNLTIFMDLIRLKLFSPNLRMFYGRNLKDKLRQAIYELKTRVILKYNSDFNKPDCNASYEICNDLYVAPIITG